MGFPCAVCLEHLDKKPAGTSETTQDGKLTNGAAKQDRIVVTTICGHMYHHDCLSTWFKTKGTDAAWSTKNCITCSKELNLAKDIIRIYTSFEDDDGLSRDEYETTIDKLKQNNKQLAHRLEQNFLSTRALEKERANLQKTLAHEKLEKNRLETICNKLNQDNMELRDLVINLNKAMAGSVTSMVPAMLAGPNQGHQRFPDQAQAGTPFHVGTNYGYHNAMTSQPAQHTSKQDNGQAKLFATSGANSSSTSPRYQTLGNDNKALSTQLSNLLLGGGGDDTESHLKYVVKRDKNDNETDRRPGDFATEEPPTDEVMDAILRAAPQVILPDVENSAPVVFRPTLKPPIRINDPERKLYGKFRCPKCEATWGNARMNFEEPQKCMKCNTSVLPYTQEPVRAKE